LLLKNERLFLILDVERLSQDNLYQTEFQSFFNNSFSNISSCNTSVNHCSAQSLQLIGSTIDMNESCTLYKNYSVQNFLNNIDGEKMFKNTEHSVDTQNSQLYQTNEI
jgi:hypothetical protein